MHTGDEPVQVRLFAMAIAVGLIALGCTASPGATAAPSGPTGTPAPTSASIPTAPPGQTAAPTQPAGTPPAAGTGTVTVAEDQHGDYTSSNGLPTHVEFSSSATITFDLVPSAADPTNLSATSSSITWTYSLMSTEHDAACDNVAKAEGGGSWTGDSGPVVLVGWKDPDGTFAAMDLDEHKYVLEAVSPNQDLPDGDPRAYYQASSSFCGGAFVDGQKPVFSVAMNVDGDLLPGATGSYSSSTVRTRPDLLGDLPITDTITWSFTIAPG